MEKTSKLEAVDYYDLSLLIATLVYSVWYNAWGILLALWIIRLITLHTNE